MTKLKFEFHTLAKSIGVFLLILGFVMGINLIVMEVLGIVTTGLIATAIQYIVYGIMVYGMGKMIQYMDIHIGEMRFFRKHYIDEVEKKKEK